MERRLPKAIVSYAKKSGKSGMAVYKLSMIERKQGGYQSPNPDECREHHDAGRLPIYYDKRLVAYVDRAEDLPEAKFVHRDGRLVGETAHWE
jgi:hypothetical protein